MRDEPWPKSCKMMGPVRGRVQALLADWWTPREPARESTAMVETFTYLDPPRRIAGVPGRATGRGVGLALVSQWYPAHQDTMPSKRRNVRYLDRDLRPYDARRESLKHPQTGIHGLLELTRAAGSGEVLGPHSVGMAPECDLVLCSTDVIDGELAFIDYDASTTEECLHSICDVVEDLNIRVLYHASAGSFTGPLVPWQWDATRRAFERLAAKGVLVVASAGNNPQIPCPQSLSPSAVCVGGVALPGPKGLSRSDACTGGVALPRNRFGEMRAFHSPEGLTFEGKSFPHALAPASPVLMAYLDPERRSPISGLPKGHTIHEGTSFAGPFIAGLAACLLQVHPDVSAQALSLAIAQAAREAEPRFGIHGLGIPTFSLVEEHLKSRDGQRDGPHPFKRYQAVQEMSWSQRVRLSKQSASHARDIALNSIPQHVPTKYVDYFVKSFETAEDPRLRAGILLLLGTDIGRIPERMLDVALMDPSPLVLGSAVELLRCNSALISPRKRLVANLIGHSVPQVRYEACVLARLSGDIFFVDALRNGIAEELREGHVGVFFARKWALTAATGQTLSPPERGMRHEECAFSEYRTRMMKECAENWSALPHPRRSEGYHLLLESPSGRRPDQALRAYFVAGMTAKEVSKRFGYSEPEVSSLIRRFKRSTRDSRLARDGSR